MTGMERAYLDYNATAPLRPEAAAAVVRALALTGNPSSIHAEGRRARSLIEAAREDVARLAGADPRAVVFTSGGSEAANTVLDPAFRRAGDAAGAEILLVGATEHPCVLDGHGFPAERVERIPVDGHGVADLAWLERRLSGLGGRRALVSLQAANNETGVIQPVAEAARLVRAAGGLVHCDAVQAAGRMALDIAALGVDALTLSGHKLGAPAGIGAIVLASEAYALPPRIRGGGQERGRRAGTENLVGIAGFGAAAEAARRTLAPEAARLLALREAAEAIVRRVPGAAIFGAGAARLPNTLLFAVPGLRAETALIKLDLAGIAASSGAACSSGRVRRSHVLDAMGVAPALAEGAIRLSFGWKSTDDDLKRLATAYETGFEALYAGKADAA